MGVEQQVGLAALLSPRPPSFAVASTTRGGGVVEAIPGHDSRRMGESVEPGASILYLLAMLSNRKRFTGVFIYTKTLFDKGTTAV